MAEITNVSIGGQQYDLCDATTREAVVDSVHYRGIKDAADILATSDPQVGDMYFDASDTTRMWLWTGVNWHAFNQAHQNVQDGDTVAVSGDAVHTYCQSMMRYKGRVRLIDVINTVPVEKRVIGDVYRFTDTDTISMWIGNTWLTLWRRPLEEVLPEEPDPVSSGAIYSFVQDFVSDYVAEHTEEAVHYRGNIGSAAMKTIDAAVGDVYQVDDGLYMWNGSEWIPFCTGGGEIGALVYKGSIDAQGLMAMTGMQDGDVWHCGSDNTVCVYMNGEWHYLDRVWQTVDNSEDAVSGNAVIDYTKNMMRFRGAMTYDEMCQLANPRLGDTCYVTDYGGIFYIYRVDGYWERVSPLVVSTVSEADSNPVSSGAVYEELSSVKEALQYKGDISYIDLLELTDVQKGDMYAVADDDTLALFNGQSWYYLRPTVRALEGGGMLPASAQGVVDHVSGYVADQLTAVWKYKGSCSTSTLAAMTDMQDGDVWHCGSDGVLYVYLNGKWRALDSVAQSVSEGQDAVSGKAVMQYVAEQTAMFTRYKGNKTSTQISAITDQQTGDMYYNGSMRYAVVWDGEHWAPLGEQPSAAVQATDTNAVSGAAVYAFVTETIKALLNGNEVAY